jgi:hypothetical protein
MKLFCPVMSAGSASRTADGGVVLTSMIMCQQDDCQLWIEVSTSTGNKVKGCAMALGPRMFEGRLRT